MKMNELYLTTNEDLTQSKKTSSDLTFKIALTVSSQHLENVYNVIQIQYFFCRGLLYGKIDNSVFLILNFTNFDHGDRQQ